MSDIIKMKRGRRGREEGGMEGERDRAQRHAVIMKDLGHVTKKQRSGASC